MGKEAKTNAMRILERAKVAYTAHEYPHEEGVAVTHRRREKCQPAQICGLLQSRDQQTPHRCRHHDPGGKAGKGALDAVTQPYV